MAVKKKTPHRATPKPKPLGTFHPPPDDLNVNQLRIQGQKKLSADVRRLTTDAELETTIEGASTLTLKIRDVQRKLLNSDLAIQASTLILDNIEYTLAKVSHAGDELTMIFEESAVNLLRQYTKPKKANRDNTTRAAFIQGMVKEVTERVIPFNCPEVKEKQKVGAK